MDLVWLVVLVHPSWWERRSSYDTGPVAVVVGVGGALFVLVYLHEAESPGRNWKWIASSPPSLVNHLRVSTVPQNSTTRWRPCVLIHALMGRGVLHTQTTTEMPSMLLRSYLCGALVSLPSISHTTRARRPFPYPRAGLPKSAYCQGGSLAALLLHEHIRNAMCSYKLPCLAWIGT